jgi:hypothetical protein
MKKYNPKLTLLASALAVAGMFALPTIGSGIAATNDDSTRVVAKAGESGQGGERSTAKGDNGQGDDRSAAKGDNGGGGKKKGGKKKGGKKK